MIAANRPRYLNPPRWRGPVVAPAPPNLSAEPDVPPPQTELERQQDALRAAMIGTAKTENARRRAVDGSSGSISTGARSNNPKRIAKVVCDHCGNLRAPSQTVAIGGLWACKDRLICQTRCHNWQTMRNGGTIAGED